MYQSSLKRYEGGLFPTPSKNDLCKIHACKEMSILLCVDLAVRNDFHFGREAAWLWGGGGGGGGGGGEVVSKAREGSGGSRI